MDSAKTDLIIERLIAIEAHVHYGEPPPPGLKPFVSIVRESPVVISAPHGTRAFRCNDKEFWHEEDEYTAGMALLLSEICKTSVIASIWRSDRCDPNFHNENRCLYKQHLRQIVRQQGVRWLIDLHGAKEDNKKMGASRVDLGSRNGSMNAKHRNKLRDFLEARLGKNSVSLNAFPALWSGTITAFCQEQLGIEAIQVEIKPSLRVPLRRVDASAFPKIGQLSANPDDLLALLSALKDFIQYLQIGDKAVKI